jgi:hypothetical protein
MLEIQRIRQEKEAILAGLAKRNIDASHLSCFCQFTSEVVSNL